MTHFFHSLLLQSPFIPHGHCYLWKPSLVWLHLTSDAIIAIAYYLIAFSLLYFVQNRADVPFRSLFWLFSAFIAACGTTHLLGIWTLWFPHYWLSGTIKGGTAFISIYTAFELIPRIPQALMMPSPKQLELLNQTLSQEVAERKAAEAVVQQLNEELEQRVWERTQALEQAQAVNAHLLQQEQAARTQLEKVLRDLQDTTERLEIALDAAQMGSWDWDIQAQSLFWSPKMHEILGFTPGTTTPTYDLWAERVHPEDLPQVEAAIAQAQQEQTVFSHEYRVCWPDGSHHWVLAQGRCVFDAHHKPLRMLGVIQETTQRKQAEMDLQSSEAKFRAVFEQAAVGMARLSPDGRWIQANHTLCELLGYETEEFLGKTFQEITDPEDHDQDEQLYHQLLYGEINACRLEKRYLHKDGSPIWTMVTASVERNANNELVAFIAVIEDIRQLKQVRTDLQQRAVELGQVNGLLAMTNALLEKRNAELDQFAYVASHDLKAPLRAIANLSEWIEEDMGDKLPEENRYQFSLLKKRVHRMESLINGLLEYSRIGRRERQLAVVDLHELLDEAIDSLSPPASFTITRTIAVSHLRTNRVALHQVFSNLISNAIKHHDRDQGHIHISAEDQDQFLVFAVTDDGPGIDPRYHEKIFAIFQTLKARDDFESTGIGLSVVKKIIENEGGKIQIESALGKGATFRFTWPK